MNNAGRFGPRLSRRVSNPSSRAFGLFEHPGSFVASV